MKAPPEASAEQPSAQQASAQQPSAEGGLGPGAEFAKLATKRRGALLSDTWFLLRTNKKYWMLPLIVLMLAFGTLVLLSNTAFAPLIYTLF